jgi:hypothetical protein
MSVRTGGNKRLRLKKDRLGTGDGAQPDDAAA